MRRLPALVLFLLPLMPVPAHAATTITAEIAVVVDDEFGAGTVDATCVAHTDPASSIAWTRVVCSTDHSTSEGSLPERFALARVRTAEAAPYVVCVFAEAMTTGGVRVSTSRCETHQATVSVALDGCRAFADPPESPHNFNLSGRGGMACAPGSDLSVSVCLQALVDGWIDVECGTGDAPTPSTYVEAWGGGCLFGLYVMRTYTRGTTGDGRTAEAGSTPIVFLCTPL